MYKYSDFEQTQIEKITNIALKKGFKRQQIIASYSPSPNNEYDLVIIDYRTRHPLYAFEFKERQPNVKQDIEILKLMQKSLTLIDTFIIYSSDTKSKTLNYRFNYALNELEEVDLKTAIRSPNELDLVKKIRADEEKDKSIRSVNVTLKMITIFITLINIIVFMLNVCFNFKLTNERLILLGMIDVSAYLSFFSYIKIGDIIEIHR